MSQELVVITGASSGIGRGIARAFAAEGHPLLLISRHIAPLPEFDGKTVRYAQADRRRLRPGRDRDPRRRTGIRRDRVSGQQRRLRRRPRLSQPSRPPTSRARSTSISRACSTAPRS
jgi:NAD(P)-dependent dehydrogenase (short-subunit alcohol dehydrogenase family)